MKLLANRVIAVYRGDREVTPENLKKVQDGFEERGYIKLRSLERILFGSNVEGAGNVVRITSDKKIALKQGLIVLDAPSTQLVQQTTFEVEVLIYNSTPFLNQVDKGGVIAEYGPN
jgi:hypothetical protein